MSLTNTQLINGLTGAPVTLGLSSGDLAAASVGTSQLAANAVTKAKMALFVGNGKIGTGSSQNIAHGLGVAPTAVIVSFEGSTTSQAVTYGSHTSTNVVVTVTTAAVFTVIAFA